MKRLQHSLIGGRAGHSGKPEPAGRAVWDGFQHAACTNTPPAPTEVIRLPSARPNGT